MYHNGELMDIKSISEPAVGTNGAHRKRNREEILKP